VEEKAITIPIVASAGAPKKDALNYGTELYFCHDFSGSFFEKFACIRFAASA
jgi:hypothetical protein